MVLGEPPVLDREERGDQVGIDVGQRHPAPKACRPPARVLRAGSPARSSSDERAGLALSSIPGGSGRASQTSSDDGDPRGDRPRAAPRAHASSRRPPSAVTVNVPPSLSPNTAGLYISSACAGGRTKTPGRRGARDVRRGVGARPELGRDVHHPVVAHLLVIERRPPAGVPARRSTTAASIRPPAARARATRCRVAPGPGQRRRRAEAQVHRLEPRRAARRRARRSAARSARSRGAAPAPARLRRRSVTGLPRRSARTSARRRCRARRAAPARARGTSVTVR